MFIIRGYKRHRYELKGASHAYYQFRRPLCLLSGDDLLAAVIIMMRKSGDVA